MSKLMYNFYQYFVFTLLQKINMVFLPSSRKGKNVFVCFSKGVLALSTEVELFSPFWSAFGLQDVIFCSWTELLASISATKQN